MWGLYCQISTTSAGCVLVARRCAPLIWPSMEECLRNNDAQSIVDMRQQEPTTRALERKLRSDSGPCRGQWTKHVPPGKHLLYFGCGDTLYRQYPSHKLDGFFQHLAEEGCATKRTIALVMCSPVLLNRMSQINEGEKFSVYSSEDSACKG